MKPFIVIERGGWWHAYASRWSWWRGKEPVLRARTWKAMETAVESMKRSLASRPPVNQLTGAAEMAEEWMRGE